ncbi:MAG: Amidohydrolase family, partial [Acidobacteriota bacterium]|nr:Amidohydrolase family [Acidobacteriota bacterium]
LPLEEALALATKNVARVLKLHDAGSLEKGKRADVLLLDAGSLTLRHLILGGELVIRDGTPLRQERYREKGNRWQSRVQRRSPPGQRRSRRSRS